MIVEALLTLVEKLLRVFLGRITVPGMPEEFGVAFEFLEQLLNYARNLISLFLPWKIVTIGFPILIAIMSAEYIYALVMWILRKIPMLGIK